MSDHESTESPSDIQSSHDADAFCDTSIASQPRAQTKDRVFRTHRNSKYKLIGCAGIEDSTVSWRSVGLLAYMITRPGNWKFNAVALESSHPGGRKALQASLKELEKRGYLRRTRVVAARGRFTYAWDVQESLDTEFNPRNASSVDGSTDDPPRDSAPRANTASASSEGASNKKQQRTRRQDHTKQQETEALEDPRVLEVFAYWQSSLDYKALDLNSRSADGKTRASRIRSRLKEGFTVEQLKQVVDSTVDDLFLRGENDAGRKYDDINNLFRNKARVEQYLDIIEDPRRAASLVAPATPGPVRRM